jgi:hypothetical protein
VLLRQIDGEFVHDFARVSSKGSKERPVAVHDYETKAGVRLEQLG